MKPGERWAIDHNMRPIYPLKHPQIKNIWWIEKVLLRLLGRRKIESTDLEGGYIIIYHRLNGQFVLDSMGREGKKMNWHIEEINVSMKSR